MAKERISKVLRLDGKENAHLALNVFEGQGPPVRSVGLGGAERDLNSADVIKEQVSMHAAHINGLLDLLDEQRPVGAGSQPKQQQGGKPEITRVASAKVFEDLPEDLRRNRAFASKFSNSGAPLSKQKQQAPLAGGAATRGARARK